jgi:hypothetical protein
MVDFQKSSYNFSPEPTRTAERRNLAELGATDLKQAFGSWEPMENWSYVLFP